MKLYVLLIYNSGKSKKNIMNHNEINFIGITIDCLKLFTHVILYGNITIYARAINTHTRAC